MALWRGLVPTLYRDVPFSAMYWLLAEATRTRAAAYLRKSQDMSEISEIGKARGTDLSYRQTIGINLMAGVVGGSLASVITHPFDVIKTRAQVRSTWGLWDWGSRCAILTRGCPCWVCV